MKRFYQPVCLAVLCLTACVRLQHGAPTVTPGARLEIGATLGSSIVTDVMTPAPTLIQATLDPVDVSVPQQANPAEYEVQPGDTMSGIAVFHGIPLESLLAANTDLANPDILTVGQIIHLPELSDLESTSFKILPDNRLVRAPGSTAFDIARFISQQPGYIRTAIDTVDGDLLTAAQVVQRVSLEFSVDARLLLALLELRSRWLTDTDPSEEAQIHPLGAGPSSSGIERDGLYRQLSWAADQLNAGYYGLKYRNLQAASFDDGQRIRFAPGLNAATVAVQFMLSQFNSYAVWREQTSPDGLYRIYVDYFGDPFQDSQEPVVPMRLSQPSLSLPFAEDETWFYTGGPHGGWGSGSAWAAIDFGPPDDLTTVDSACYVSAFWARAVAPGVIARTDTGTVILDVDGDGDESTGWTILYLHLAADGRVAEHAQVNAGDPLGKPSCEGGVSNGTHLHIARRYNGEWIPAECPNCSPALQKPAFVLGKWTVIGLPGQEYQGFLQEGGEQRTADQGRLSQDNLVSW